MITLFSGQKSIMPLALEVRSFDTPWLLNCRPQNLRVPFINFERKTDPDIGEWTRLPPASLIINESTTLLLLHLWLLELRGKKRAFKLVSYLCDACEWTAAALSSCNQSRFFPDLQQVLKSSGRSYKKKLCEDVVAHFSPLVQSLQQGLGSHN